MAWQVARLVVAVGPANLAQIPRRWGTWKRGRSGHVGPWIKAGTSTWGLQLAWRSRPELLRNLRVAVKTAPLPTKAIVRFSTAESTWTVPLQSLETVLDMLAGDHPS
jgi:hypothetical protein